MLDSAWARLAGRAVVAGLLVFVSQVAASDQPFSQQVLLAAAGAGVLAALEILTPLNRQVGVGS